MSDFWPEAKLGKKKILKIWMKLYPLLSLVTYLLQILKTLEHKKKNPISVRASHLDTPWGKWRRW